MEKFYTKKVIDIEDCKYFSKKIFNLRKEWKRKELNFFYTLGSPLYQAPKCIQDYFEEAKIYNHLILSNFSDLYGLILDVLSRELNLKLSYFYPLSIPGFHIFEFNNNSQYHGGGPHFDLSYQSLKCMHQDLIFAGKNITFTLPLELPKQGSGIEIWDFHYFDRLSSGREESLFSIAKRLQSKYYDYKLGFLSIYSGFFLHQIPSHYHVGDGDNRITLQGHCANINGDWIVFW